MKHRVLKELHTALVITMDSGRIHLMIKEIRQKFVKPHYFVDYHTQCYILCLCGTQGHRSLFTQGHRALFPVAPGNHGRPCYPPLLGITRRLCLEAHMSNHGVPRARSTCAWPWRAHLFSLSAPPLCQQQQQHPSPSAWSCIRDGSCSMR
jgi:hypothetical protein